MKNVKILFIFCLLWSACENEQINPTENSINQEDDENQLSESSSIQDELNGLWTLDNTSSTICKVSTDECNTVNLEAGESDYFKFSTDSVEYQIYGSVEKYPLEIVSNDSLKFKGHSISEYFIIENLNENNLTLSFYMDHTHENVNDANDITDMYYLSR